MNEVWYFTIRAQHYHQLAMDASDSRLKEVLEAIAVDMSAKVATADPNRQVSGPEPVQEAMDERMDRRIKVRRRGWLSATTGAELEECIIWDESTIGARLVVAAKSEISDTILFIYVARLYVGPALSRRLALRHTDRRRISELIFGTYDDRAGYVARRRGYNQPGPPNQRHPSRSTKSPPCSARPIRHGFRSSQCRKSLELFP